MWLRRQQARLLAGEAAEVDLEGGLDTFKPHFAGLGKLLGETVGSCHFEEVAFHCSHRANRGAIRSKGLLPRVPSVPFLDSRGYVDMPKAVYVFRSFRAADENRRVYGNDIWMVDIAQLPAEQDKFYGPSGGVAILAPIPPARVRPFLFVSDGCCVRSEMMDEWEVQCACLGLRHIS